MQSEIQKWLSLQIGCYSVWAVLISMALPQISTLMTASSSSQRTHYNFTQQAKDTKSWATWFHLCLTAMSLLLHLRKKRMKKKLRFSKSPSFTRWLTTNHPSVSLAERYKLMKQDIKMKSKSLKHGLSLRLTDLILLVMAFLEWNIEFWSFVSIWSKFIKNLTHSQCLESFYTS